MEKICAIVGFGPGNGLALAKAFADDGHRLALLARSRTKQNAALTELESAGFPANFFEADAADQDSLGAAFAKIRSEVGDPTVLIYNAFAMRMGPPSKTTPQDLASDFRTNVAGALAAVQEVLPAMRAAEAGTIIFTGGGFALDPLPNSLPFPSAKRLCGTWRCRSRRNCGPPASMPARSQFAAWSKPGRISPRKKLRGSSSLSSTSPRAISKARSSIARIA